MKLEGERKHVISIDTMELERNNEHAFWVKNRFCFVNKTPTQQIGYFWFSVSNISAAVEMNAAKAMFNELQRSQIWNAFAFTVVVRR